MADTLSLTLAAGLALALGLRPFAEPDLWWHLRVGEHIRQTGQLVGPDPWAAFADRDYMATQWLPEVIASWAFEAGGLGAILLLRTTAIVVLATIVYAMCRRGASPGLAAAVTASCLLAATTGLNPRPQLLSFIFFAITVAAWRATAQDHRPRWWLAPMFWLWGCCHGLWVFGLVIGGVTLLAIVADRRAPMARSSVRRLGLLNLLCVAAIAVTPLGPALWLAPFNVAGNASWIADEWQRTPFDVPASIVAAAMVLVAAGLYARRRFAPLWEYAHLCMGTLLLVWMWRLVPLAVVLIAPLLATALHGRLRPSVPSRWRSETWTRCVSVGAILLAAGVVSLGDRGASASSYPASMTAVDATLDCQAAGDVVFNDFGLSGWLLWRHPQLVPVADLRSEIYSREHMEDFYVAEAVEPGWDSVVAETGASVALLKPDAPLARALVQESGWQLAASSPGAILLRNPGSSPPACGD